MVQFLLRVEESQHLGFRKRNSDVLSLCSLARLLWYQYFCGVAPLRNRGIIGAVSTVSAMLWALWNQLHHFRLSCSTNKEHLIGFMRAYIIRSEARILSLFRRREYFLAPWCTLSGAWNAKHRWALLRFQKLRWNKYAENAPLTMRFIWFLKDQVQNKPNQILFRPAKLSIKKRKCIPTKWKSLDWRRR